MEKLIGLKPISETQTNILRSQSKRICIAAGRRWGKTTTLALYSLWHAITYKKAKVFIVTPSWEQATIFMDSIRDLIDMMHKAIRQRLTISVDRKMQMTIEGAQIIARSSTKTSRSIRGHGATLLVRDEDAFIPDEVMPSIRPIRIDKSAKELVASTPLGHNHFWKDYHSKIYESFHAPTSDNNLIDKKEVEQEKQLLTKTEFQQEYEAAFVDDRYSVFPQRLIDLAVNFDLGFVKTPSPEIDYVMGVDLGRRRDASVVTLLHAENNQLYVDYIREFTNPFTGSFWTKVLNEIEILVQKFNVKHLCIDQTGIGDKPTEDLKENIASHNLQCYVQGIDFTRRLKNSKEGLINALLLKFERQEIHFPFVEKLIRQLKNIRFEASKTPSVSMQTFGRYISVGHDDYVTSLILAIHALPKSSDIFYTRSNPIKRQVFEPLPLLQVTSKFFEE